jgi:hypothetical protein
LESKHCPYCMLSIFVLLSRCLGKLCGGILVGATMAVQLCQLNPSHSLIGKVFLFRRVTGRTCMKTLDIILVFVSVWHFLALYYAETRSSCWLGVVLSCAGTMQCTCLSFRGLHLSDRELDFLLCHTSRVKQISSAESSVCRHM